MSSVAEGNELWHDVSDHFLRESLIHPCVIWTIVVRDNFVTMLFVSKVLMGYELGSWLFIWVFWLRHGAKTSSETASAVVNEGGRRE